MIARLRSWGQKLKKPLEVVTVFVGCVVIIALLVVIILVYLFKVNVPGLNGKNLWDWLQLLIIPAVLAVGGYLFNYTTSRTEREVASAKQREDALQAYIDSMSALLLERDLRKKVVEVDDEVRNLARVRTLTTLARLDATRKRTLLQFLYESGLLKVVKPKRDLGGIIDLRGANLRGVDLRAADLGKVFLKGADLRGANLRGADLRGADLGEAMLEGANLRGAYADDGGGNVIGIFAYEEGFDEVGVWRDRSDVGEFNLQEANLFKADLRGANLRGADLRGADLRGANLRGADLRRANLDKANLHGTTPRHMSVDIHGLLK